MLECLEIDRYHPRPDLVHRLVKAIKQGAVVACPTDTTYGVFTDLHQADAVARLRRLRARMAGVDEATLADKPLSMVFADLTMLSEYVVLSGLAFQLVKRLLPGPYTIVLPAGRAVPKKLQTKRRDLGVRIPDDALVQALVGEHGLPLLVTTLKDGDGELLGDPIAISRAWPRDLDFVVDAGWFVPEESTVLAIDSDEVELLREGKGPIDVISL
jgi:tRNA threonylcarbamoyl adenosine modification protein (Sua5/YciO/YrdC/YwlC family)